MNEGMATQKENQRQAIERLLMAVSKGLDLIKDRALKTNNKIIGPRSVGESPDREKQEARAGFLGGIIDALETFQSKTREIDEIQRALERETTGKFDNKSVPEERAKIEKKDEDYY